MNLRTTTFLLFAFAGLSLFAADVPTVHEKSPLGVTADEVIGRMLQMDSQRLNDLQQYEARRRYIVDNRRFDKHAEMEFREQYVYPGYKKFDLVSEEGTGYIRHKVIQKMIDAELDSVNDENRDQTKVTPVNYDFRLLGADEQEGRSCYVLEVSPKKRKKYLMDGRIWVDQRDFAIVRMEGKPAKSPSFFTRDVHFVRRYKKYGSFWLTDSLESESSVWIVGKSTLKIEYSDYAIHPAPRSPGTPSASSIGQASLTAGAPTIEALLPGDLKRALQADYVNRIALSVLPAPQPWNVAPQQGQQP
jgi:hypothetical protein